ncbi:GntR family transcriptional regulator [Mesorhizobium sp. BR1-1-16]|uniref:GntR family transcriptional regulator n=1 Tax=Mesorhizobium sp. BR1-1-16 TaxID=2876653 RepID=UPI001CD01749|nr:GntR family transcriptional regulator [Mesorhizobium sp. BR1-1-16]
MANKNPRKTVAAPGEGSRLSDVAYARILETLFERRIPAGAFVSQSDLVELTGVPVGPLRDALRVLEGEGVVTIHPRTGIQFVKPGMELTRSTYQFRGIIESAAVATFADTASDADIAELESRHLKVIAQIETEGFAPAFVAELEALENLLHGSIVASLDNVLIDSSYRRVRNYLRLLRLDRRMTGPLVLRSLREHAAILDACRRRNPAEAVAALQAHFSAALQRSLGLY